MLQLQTIANTTNRNPAECSRIMRISCLSLSQKGLLILPVPPGVVNDGGVTPGQLSGDGAHVPARQQDRGPRSFPDSKDSLGPISFRIRSLVRFIYLTKLPHDIDL